MKTDNELTRTLSEVELAEVHGGQDGFLARVEQTHARIRAMAESIDRLAVMDPRMISVLEPRSPLGALVGAGAAPLAAGAAFTLDLQLGR